MVKIFLPNPTEYQYPGGIDHFLRQLELSVHHAQKAYKEIKNQRKESGEAETNEDEFIVWRQPQMDFYDIENSNGSDSEGYIKVHVDWQTDDGQELILEINEG